MTQDQIALGKLKVTRKQFSMTLLVLLVGIGFILGYIVHKYFSDGLLDITSPGFWIGAFSFILLTSIVVFYKNKLSLSWSDLGMAKPANWWQPLLVIAGTYGAIVLFSIYVRPFILELGDRPGIDHLMGIPQNLPKLIFALIVVWITAAFLEELIFRAFLINIMEDLLGNTPIALGVAVVLSSVIFGLMHAYQGLTGMVMTGSLGLIFGIAYVLNGKRIWPLIVVHGAIDTIALISIYNMPVQIMPV